MTPKYVPPTKFTGRLISEAHDILLWLNDPKCGIKVFNLHKSIHKFTEQEFEYNEPIAEIYTLLY